MDTDKEKTEEIFMAKTRLAFLRHIEQSNAYPGNSTRKKRAKKNDEKVIDMKEYLMETIEEVEKAFGGVSRNDEEADEIKNDEEPPKKKIKSQLTKAFTFGFLYFLTIVGAFMVTLLLVRGLNALFVP